MIFILNHDLLIIKLIEEKVNELHSLLHDKKSVLSDRPLEIARRELNQYQELLSQTRLNQQMEMR